MTATDYTFCEGMIDIYLARKKKRKDGLMSEDRRPLTEQEQLYIAEHFLRRYCGENHTEEVQITNPDGKPIFKMVLLGKDKEEQP